MLKHFTVEDQRQRPSKTFDPKTFLATVSRGRTVASYRKDTIVYRQAAAADAVYYIQKGKIKIVVASKARKRSSRCWGPGDFFGEGCLIGQPSRLATAKAMGESGRSCVSARPRCFAC